MDDKAKIELLRQVVEEQMNLLRYYTACAGITERGFNTWPEIVKANAALEKTKPADNTIEDKPAKVM